MRNDLQKLTEQIQVFGKENLSDILHYTAIGLKSIFGCLMVRVYLEDLHQGILICQYMTDNKNPYEQQITKFISPANLFMKTRLFGHGTCRSGLLKTEIHLKKCQALKPLSFFPLLMS